MKPMIDVPVRVSGNRPQLLSLPIFRIAFVCVLLVSAFSASAQWLPTPWTSGPIYFPGTNVGIGTSDTSLANDCDAGLVIAGSSPALRLHGTSGSNMDAVRRALTGPLPIIGGGCGDYQLSAGGDTGGFMIFDACAGAPRLTIDSDGNVGADSLAAYTLKVGSADSGWLTASAGMIQTNGGPLSFGSIVGGPFQVIEHTWMTMTSAGNVGIGSSTSPVHQLDVSGVPVVNGGANEVLGVYDNRAFAAGVGGGIAFGGKINATETMAQNFASIQGIKENATSGDTASALLFFTHANAGTPAERMRIGSDGLLTVGATGGTGMKLAVNGSIRSFSGGFQFPDGTTQVSAAIGSQWGQSGSSIYYSAGNVGIGSGMTSPSSPLSVNGVVYSAAGGFKFPDNTVQTSAAINSQWGQSGSSLSYTAGNVGIGSGMTSPTSPLSVNGVVYSAAGGFKFPDNTIQTTAAQGSGGWNPGQVAGSVFHSGGSVGIGTDHPDAPFQVVTAGGVGALVTASSTDAFLRVDSTNTSHPYADFILSNSAGPAYGEIRVGDNATWRNLVLLKNGGAVAIGNETSPAASLHVKGTATTSGAARRTIVAFDSSSSAAGVGGGISFGGNYSATSSTTDFANIWGIKEVATDNDKSGALLFGTTSNAGTPTERMRIGSNGLVTIAGTGTGTRLKVQGDIDVDGNINAKYQDVAEWVPTAEMLPAGTVVVLDPSVSNQVMASVDAYATTVAGVISDRPGITLGEGGAMKLKVATTGRVKVKVDATKSAVHIGDLLVTGDRPGTAMKSQPIDVGGMKIHRPGTLIGKALEPLAGGQGEILVLLSLQ